MRKRTVHILLSIIAVVVLVALLLPKRLVSFLAKPVSEATECSILMSGIDGAVERTISADEWEAFRAELEQISVQFRGIYRLGETSVIDMGTRGYLYRVGVYLRSEEYLLNMGEFSFTETGFVYIGRCKYAVLDAQKSTLFDHIGSYLAPKGTAQQIVETAAIAQRE